MKIPGISQQQRLDQRPATGDEIYMGMNFTTHQGRQRFDRILTRIIMDRDMISITNSNPGKLPPAEILHLRAEMATVSIIRTIKTIRTVNLEKGTKFTITTTISGQLQLPKHQTFMNILVIRTIIIERRRRDQQRQLVIHSFSIAGQHRVQNVRRISRVICQFPITMTHR